VKETFFDGIPENFLSKEGISSAGLTIVANVAIVTGPALLGAPRSFVKFNFIICKGGY